MREPTFRLTVDRDGGRSDLAAELHGIAYDLERGLRWGTGWDTEELAAGAEEEPAAPEAEEERGSMTGMIREEQAGDRYVARFRPRDRAAGTFPAWAVIDTQATEDDGPAIAVCTTVYEDRARLVTGALNAADLAARAEVPTEEWAGASVRLAQADADAARTAARALLRVVERWLDGARPAGADGTAILAPIARTDAELDPLRRMLAQIRVDVLGE